MVNYGKKFLKPTVLKLTIPLDLFFKEKERLELWRFFQNYKEELNRGEELLKVFDLVIFIRCCFFYQRFITKHKINNAYQVTTPMKVQLCAIYVD